MEKRGNFFSYSLLTKLSYRNLRNFCPLFCPRKRADKRGAWELEEIGKIAIAVLFLVVLAFIVIFLFKGGGGKILDTLKNMLRFGR